MQESTDFGVNTIKIYGECCGMSVAVHDASLFSQMTTLALRTALGGRPERSLEFSGGRFLPHLSK